MKKNVIDRTNYYTEDYEGFAIFLITRAYNDLQINTSLFEGVKGKGKDEAQIYFFKLLTSHLKETLKLLGIIKTSDRFKEIMNKWRSNKIIDKTLNEISDELENPTIYKDTINAKYLNYRNEVFHYCNESKDFEEYKLIQKNLEKQKLNVVIEENNKGAYSHELGVDIQISQGIFNENTVNEVNELKKKVQLILREILNDYYTEKAQ